MLGGYKHLTGKWNPNTLAIYVSVRHINPEEEIPGVEKGKVEDGGHSEC